MRNGSVPKFGKATIKQYLADFEKQLDEDIAKGNTIVPINTLVDFKKAAMDLKAIIDANRAKAKKAK